MKSWAIILLILCVPLYMMWIIPKWKMTKTNPEILQQINTLHQTLVKYRTTIREDSNIKKIEKEIKDIIKENKAAEQKYLEKEIAFLIIENKRILNEKSVLPENLVGIHDIIPLHEEQDALIENITEMLEDWNKKMSNDIRRGKIEKLTIKNISFSISENKEIGGHEITVKFSLPKVEMKYIPLFLKSIENNNRFMGMDTLNISTKIEISKKTGEEIPISALNLVLYGFFVKPSID